MLLGIGYFLNIEEFDLIFLTGNKIHKSNEKIVVEFVGTVHAFCYKEPTSRPSS